MRYFRIYKLYASMLALSLVLIVGFQLVFRNFPHFTVAITAIVLSLLLVTFITRKLPHYGPKVLFGNITVMTIGVYGLAHATPLTAALLFFLPIYALLFQDRRYFRSGQIFAAVGYLLMSLDMPIVQHVIFFILFALYCFVLNYVYQEAVRTVSQVAKFQEQVEVFSKAIEARDSYTQGHSRRVSLYAVEIGKLVPGVDLDLLKVAGDLHDIGKIATPDHVLLKPGRLTAEEYEIIKQHSINGYNLLKQFDIDQTILDGVLYHHERMNGTGYPMGLSGAEIPLVARILAIADTFDAMTTTRSYRNAFPTQTAYDEIVSLAGKFYDPQLVECFQKTYPSILAIFEREEAMRETQSTPTAV